MAAAPVTDQSCASSTSGQDISQATRGIAKFETKSGQRETEEDDDDTHKRSHGTPNCAPVGCLTIHIKHCWDFKKFAIIKKGDQCIVKMSLGSKRKCTMQQLFKDPKAQNPLFPLCFNERKYFSVKVPYDTKTSSGTSEDEQLDLELIVLEQETRVPRLIGKNSIKLLDILNKTTVAQQVELRLLRQGICKLELDLMFVYGRVGYGYSHQLIHPNKTLNELVERSMFLRCLPPDDRKDSHFNVITPRSVPPTDFVEALLKMDASGTSSSLSGIPPIVLEMLEKRGRLRRLHDEKEACSSSEEEVRFLENLVMRKGPPSESTWRRTKTSQGLSKWKKATTLVSNAKGFVLPAKRNMPGDQMLMRASTATKSVPASQQDVISWENERHDLPPDASKTNGKPPSAPLHYDPPPPPASGFQQTIALKSTTTHKPALQSAVVCLARTPDLPQSSSPLRHVTGALPPTNKPKVTFLPAHPTSLHDLTAVEEVEERFGKLKVTAPGSVLLHAPTPRLVKERESRQESPAEGPSDGEMRLTQTDAVGTSITSATGSASSTPWALLSEANMTSLHSCSVFPLLDRSPIPAASQKTKAFKAGKERPKIVDSPRHPTKPYERLSLNKDYHGKM